MPQKDHDLQIHYPHTKIGASKSDFFSYFLSEGLKLSGRLNSQENL